MPADLALVRLPPVGERPRAATEVLDDRPQFHLPDPCGPRHRAAPARFAERP